MKKHRNRVETVRTNEPKPETRQEVIETTRIDDSQPQRVKVTLGGPVVVEVSAQCWNCGSIHSAIKATTSNGRAISRMRECQRCKTVYETREVLRYGASSVGAIPVGVG